LFLRKIYKNLLLPLLFRFDAETVHEATLSLLKVLQKSDMFCGAIERVFSAPASPVEIMGIKFPNFLGLAAGFDKNGEVPKIISKAGFGFVEIGTVTLHPQKGNPRPRLFRFPEEKTIVNRMGFNNAGAEKVARNLKKAGKISIPLGINIGKNSDCPIEKAPENYIRSIEILHPLADYLVLNISCPNIENLRELHRRDRLSTFLTRILNFMDAGKIRKPLFIKISPDIGDGDMKNVVVEAERRGLGIIASNTTTNAALSEKFGIIGAFSGQPLDTAGDRVIKKIRRISKSLPLIASGGILSAESALRKLEIGAHLIQIYSGLIFEGPSFAKDLIRYIESARKAENEKDGRKNEKKQDRVDIGSGRQES